MNRKNCLIVLVAAISIVLPAGGKEKETSGQRTSSCIVMVSMDPQVLPLNFGLIESLIYSDGVGVKAIKDTLNLAGEDIDTYKFFSVEPCGGREPQAPPPGMPGMMGGGMMGRMGGMGMGGGMMGGRDMPSGMMGGGYGGPPGGGIAPMPPEQPAPPASGKTDKPVVPSKEPKQMTAQDQQMMMRSWMPRPEGYGAGAVPNVPSHTITFVLKTHIPDDIDAKPAAVEITNAVIKNLKGQLDFVYQSYRNSLAGQIANLQQNARETEDNLGMLQSKLQAVGGGRDLRRDNLSDKIQGLSGSIESMRRECRVWAAQVERLEKQILDMKKEMSERIAGDTIKVHLEEMIILTQQEVERTKKLMDAGQVSAEQMDKAMKSLFEAKIKLAEYLKKLENEAGGPRLRGLQDELGRSTATLTDATAMIQAKERELAETKELMGKTNEYEILMLKIDAAKANLNGAITNLNRLRQQSLLLQPSSVYMIGTN